MVGVKQETRKLATMQVTRSIHRFTVPIRPGTLMAVQPMTLVVMALDSYHRAMCWYKPATPI
jgi:hypothetical protein